MAPFRSRQGLHPGQQCCASGTLSGCRDIVDKTVKKWGKVDILVNNAAYQGPMQDDIRKLSRERLEFTFKTNIIAYFSMAQKCIEHMARGSAIIDVCSINAYMPQPAILDYASTKVRDLQFKLVAEDLSVQAFGCKRSVSMCRH